MHYGRHTRGPPPNTLIYTICGVYYLMLGVCVDLCTIMIRDDYYVCLSAGGCGRVGKFGVSRIFLLKPIQYVRFIFQKYIYGRCAHLSLSMGKRYFHISSLYRRVTFPYSGMPIFTFHFLHSETFQRRTPSFYRRHIDFYILYLNFELVDSYIIKKKNTIPTTRSFIT